ncbi:ANTAR domain-containing response regulator [Phytohalomonas tamaricis]|uniref:ANTAR domain-containing response regulator n=1 Tax=Phytohalomonas tamaricis TaxID=2081032 RepID=UPI000D0B5F39|nr:ANTAR domain-containing protein [Phytohalomonas tamaricis]
MNVRVLIVDTKAERSQALDQALREAGFDVLMTVSQDDDLYAVMKRLKPDAVIIDTSLPSRDTLEHLGQLGKRYPKPMIMLAQEETPELTREATQAGVSAYVVDHLQPALVRSMVNVAISSFESHHALKSELNRTRETITQRRTIDRAKTTLMERRSMSEDAAYQYLRKIAMDRRLSMYELARDLLKAIEKGD